MDCNPSVLFVDDNESMLRSLARLLTGQQSKWTVLFARSGQEALSILADQACDVVVSDANLPDMTGCMLMDQIRDARPQTLRIILTSRSEDGIVSGLLQSAHQLLSTPCPAERLVNAVQTTCRLRDLYMNRSVRTMIHKMTHLPVVPKIYTDLRAELGKENFTLQAAGDIIAQDMGLTADLLKIVNSSYFSLARRIDSPRQAVTILGVTMLTGLVLHQQLLKTLDPAKYPGFNVERLWAHSLEVARWVRTIAKREGLQGHDVENAFLAGLFHDLGKIVLNEGVPDEYIHVLRKSQTENIPLVAAESAVLGVTHAEIGAYVLGLWDFDHAVVRAIAAHHEPSRHEDAGTVSTILHCVNVFLHDMYIKNTGHHPLALDEEYIAAQGMTDTVCVWQNAISDAWRNRHRPLAGTLQTPRNPGHGQTHRTQA